MQAKAEKGLWSKDAEKEPEKSEGPDFDSISMESGLNQWIYGVPGSAGTIPTNDRVMIVSDRAHYENEQKANDLILIPKLDFAKIDNHRQYPKENSKNEEYQKKMEKIMNSHVSADAEQALKLAMELKNKSKLVQQQPNMSTKKLMSKKTQQAQAPTQAPQQQQQQESHLKKPHASSSATMVNEGEDVNVRENKNAYVPMIILVLLIFLLFDVLAISTYPFAVPLSAIYSSTSSDVLHVVIFFFSYLLIFFTGLPGFTSTKLLLAASSGSVLVPMLSILIIDLGLHMAAYFLLRHYGPLSRLLHHMKSYPIIKSTIEIVTANNLWFAMLVVMHVQPLIIVLILTMSFQSTFKCWLPLVALIVLQSTLMSLLSLDPQSNFKAVSGDSHVFSGNWSEVLYATLIYVRLILTVCFGVKVIKTRYLQVASKVASKKSLESKHDVSEVNVINN